MNPPAQSISMFEPGSRLGIGGATLMRLPSSRAQAALLESLYEIGYRHIDTAPSYGLGRGESALRSHLKAHPDVTVTTKFGMVPGRAAKLAAPVQKPIRAAIRRWPALGGVSRRVMTTRDARSLSPDTEALQASLRASAERLGRSEVDAILIHEPEWSAEWGSTWDEIIRNGLESARNIGIAADRETLLSMGARRRAQAQIIQTPWTSPFLESEQLSSGCIVFYAAVSSAFEIADKLSHTGFFESLAKITGFNPTSESGRAFSLIGLTMAQKRECHVIIGTTNSRHAHEAWSIVDSTLEPLAAVSTSTFDELKRQFETFLAN